MTGAYLRVQRDGNWHSIEVEYLTPDELREAMQGRPPEELIRWLDLLCRVVSEHAHEWVQNQVKD